MLNAKISFDKKIDILLLKSQKPLAHVNEQSQKTFQTMHNTLLQHLIQTFVSEVFHELFVDFITPMKLAILHNHFSVSCDKVTHQHVVAESTF